VLRPSSIGVHGAPIIASFLPTAGG
jgi:hypothetical protein